MFFSLWMGWNTLSDCAFSAPVQCSLRQNHQTAKTPHKEPVLEPSDWAANHRAATLIGWLCGDKVPAEGHTSPLLEDDSTMQRKERALHSKSSVIGEHQSVCRSTKSTAVPTLFPSALTQDGFPKRSTCRLHSHLCHNGTKISFASSCLGEARPRSANRVWDLPLLAMDG